ncbi:hypothetical protein LRS13_09165 [Svornostia abyssi]|uniref:Glycosyltransferase n=1 Tax=Svornostia abyssi TaxID=2898438 RepID=A0ABY5PM84_9ACTN|nr:hypothetical protein LRS13_09165 [Parviterribacteraceae bacterium J379]
MRVLFLMGHPGYARNLGSTIQALAARGHDVVIGLDRGDREGNPAAAAALAAVTARHPELRVAVTLPPPRRAHPARAVRLLLDQLHQLDCAPPGATTSLRAAALLPAPVRPLLRVLTAVGPQRRRRLRRPLRALARALSTSDIGPFLEEIAPDVVVVTPLVDLASPQPDDVLAARARGIPAALLVHSWDNLTTKGMVHGDPDLVLVWNVPQAHEATEFHDIEPARVTVTGAPGWDEWFDAPAPDRTACCARLGLDPAQALLTYVCSSPFVAPDEAEAVARWVDAVRSASDPRVRDAGLVVRGHPARPLGAAGVTLARRHGVVVIDPADTQDEPEDYFALLACSDAVVGVNTSAMLEAAIAGTPVLTLLDAACAAGQERTRHFHHLLGDPPGTGLVRVGHSVAEHVAQLGEELAGTGRGEQRSQRFVASFIRPFGADTAATHLVVDAIERLASPEAAAAGPASAPVRAPSIGGVR